jgi:DNA-binding GntR family transcriptional regulator
MSFLPVSEAFLRLEFEGLLESRPRAGTRVRIPTRQDVRGHYMVREALEVQAARLFAEMATAEERSELVQLGERVDQTLASHEKFHRRIAECARCGALADAIEKTHALASAWLCAACPPAAEAPSTHRELAEVLAAGDPAAAAEAMRSHIARSMQSALQRLEPYFRLRRTQGRTYTRSALKLAAKVASIN